MPGKIFISYRREDVPGDARGIHDALAAKFGHGNVFMDVDNLLAGQRFDRELDKALDACDVLLAVIGPRWMDLLKARTASDERDYVRDEIAAALKRRIVVIPVRVGQEGRMPPLPRQDELPEDIRDLVLYQKHDVAHERFRRDMADLTAAIQTVRRGERRPLAWRVIAAASLAFVLLSGAVVLYQAGMLGGTAGNRGLELETTPARQPEMTRPTVIEAKPKTREAVAVAALPVQPVRATRVALVIGNADYRVGPLRHPANDAAAIAEALTKLNFKVVLKRNLGNEEFRVALREMARESADADMGVVYFSGHGTEFSGRNFLIPVDATLAKASDLDLEAIALDTVLNQLAGAIKLRLVILDANRNNQFPLNGGMRSVTRGLARIEPQNSNTIVAYAARHGTISDDGVGQYSPYTAALLKHLGTPGLDVRLLFGRVRDDVLTATRRKQEPYVYGALGGETISLDPQ